MSRPDVVWLAKLMGELISPESAPPAPLNSKWVQSGSFGLPWLPILMTLGRLALHWARMVFRATVATAPVMLIEYQSADRVRPSTQCGVRTMPPDMVRAV